MAGGRFRINTNYLVISFAIAFVLYHLAQYIFGPAFWLGTLLSRPAPVVQPKPVQAASQSASPLANPALPELGLQTAVNLWPDRITMPSVGIDLPLTGSIEKDGAWDISLTGADFALNTAVPNGQTGNTAIFGHDRPGLFHPIHNLKSGDPIFVQTPMATYTYFVTGSKVVPPSDISVMNQAIQPTLTLITCDGWLSQNRFVITAIADAPAKSSNTLTNNPTF